MTFIALVYGLISGAILALMLLISMPLIDWLGYDFAEILGYTTLVGAFLLVFFGIRRYRELSGGSLTFGRGFLAGLMITLVSSLCYVVAWQFISTYMVPDFMDKFGAHLIEEARAEGASPAEIEAQQAQMRYYKDLYANPLTKAAITFMEAFPIGLLVTIVSAAVLRRKPSSPPA